MQFTLCALHRTAAAPYSEDIRQPHRAAGMYSLYMSEIHRPWALRSVDVISRSSLHCVAEARMFHVKYVGPGGRESSRTRCVSQANGP